MYTDQQDRSCSHGGGSVVGTAYHAVPIEAALYYRLITMTVMLRTGN